MRRYDLLRPRIGPSRTSEVHVGPGPHAPSVQRQKPFEEERAEPFVQLGQQEPPSGAGDMRLVEPLPADSEMHPNTLLKSVAKA